MLFTTIFAPFKPLYEVGFAFFVVCGRLIDADVSWLGCPILDGVLLVIEIDEVWSESDFSIGGFPMLNRSF